jgi:hypothetical protein
MSEGKDTPDWEERQFEDGVALAERMGGTVAPEDVYTDVVSASKFSKKERKDYLRLLAAIEAPDGPRIVVAWMEDRAHRQVLELAEFIDVCREHGVRVATLRPSTTSTILTPSPCGSSRSDSPRPKSRRRPSDCVGNANRRPRRATRRVAVLATSASRSGSRAKTAGWCPATPFPCLASGRSRS